MEDKLLLRREKIRAREELRPEERRDFSAAIVQRLTQLPEYQAAETVMLYRAVKGEVSLEGLSGKIPGLLSIRVLTPALSSSTADLMLDSTFASPEAFALYKEHPAHLEVANERVRPFVQVRLSFDY